MAVNGWIIERTVDLAHPPKTLRNEQPYEIAYTGDMANPVWTVHVLQDGQPVALGGSVKAYIRRIDGAEVISNGTISRNTVTVKLGGSNFGQPGYTWGILRYTDSTTNATVTLDALSMLVQADPEGTSVLDPDDMLPTLQELLAELDDMRDATAAAEAAVSFIASEYSSSGTYAVGDYAIQSGHLYRCTTPITTPETWNSEHWTQVVFGNEIIDLKSAFDATENDLFKLIGNIQSPWGKGGMYVATGIEYADSSKIRTPFIKVNPGDTIYIENPDTTLQLSILEFASNTTTTSGTNERLAITYAESSVKSVTLGNSTNYIRLQLPTGDTAKGDDILVYTPNSVVNNAISAEATAREAADDELRSAISDCFNAFPTDNVNGDVAHYSDGADAPIKSLVAAIRPIQLGCGDPSAENIRPITGWNKIVIARTGPNMLTNCWSILPVESNGITWSKSDDGKIIANGTATADSTLAFNFATNTEIIPQGTYVYGGCPDGGGAATYNMYVWDNTDNNRPQRGESDTRASINVTNSAETGTFYVPHGHAIRAILRIMSGVTVTNLVFSPFVVITGQNAAWASPIGEAVSIVFPEQVGIVYGGNLDVPSGKLTITHRLYTFNGSEFWGSPQTGARFETSIAIQDTILSWMNGGRGLSNIGMYTNNDKTADVSYITSRSNINSNGQVHTLVFPLSIASNIDEAKTFLAAHNEQWYAPLAEPITYQLSPAVVNSLYGENNVFVDAGNVSVEYRADTSMYINRKISEAIAALSTL